MGIVGQGNYNLAACPHKLPVQFLDCVRKIKYDFWHIGPGFDIAPAFKLKYIAFRSQHNTLRQPFQDAPARCISHCSLLLALHPSDFDAIEDTSATNRCGEKRPIS